MIGAVLKSVGKEKNMTWKFRQIINLPPQKTRLNGKNLTLNPQEI
jgi:hypothetical protein